MGSRWGTTPRMHRPAWCCGRRRERGWWAMACVGVAAETATWVMDGCDGEREREAGRRTREERKNKGRQDRLETQRGDDGR